MKVHQYGVLILLTLMINTSSAESHSTWDIDIDGGSFTLDNDVFLGNDNGYTNGLFLSVYDIGSAKEQPTASRFVWPLQWSLADQQYDAAVNAYSVGQVMMTPDDITVEDPSEDQLPYSGLLFFNVTYLAIGSDFTDKLSTTLGIVGPASGAKVVQKRWHKIIDADDPKGWDTQLENELVFQLSRGRLWRHWTSDNDSADVLLSSELAIGTLSSYAESSLVLRYGEGLKRSYASVLLNNSRTTNPVAIDNGWYVYAGMTAGYTFNQIYTDGNTFRDSRSIDYDHERLGVTAGIAYSWGDVSITLALNDANILDTRSEEELEDLTQYGSLSVAYKLK